MKWSTVRNLAFAGTVAGLMTVPISVNYLENQLEANKSPELKKLEQIDKQVLNPIPRYEKISLLNEKEKILSNPNFEKIKSNYDSKNRDSAWGALYIILGGATLSIGSLGSFRVYQSKNSKK